MTREDSSGPEVYNHIPAGPSPLRGARVRLYVASALVDSVTAAYSIAVFAFAQEELGASPAELGYLGAAIAGAYSAGCLLTAGWSDRRGSLGFLRGSLTSLVVVVVATLLAAGLRSLAALFAINLAYGLAIALFWPPFLRELSLLSPGRLLWRSVGVFNFSWAAGSAVGSYGGPALFADVGLGATLGILAGVLVLALGALALRAPKGVKESEHGLEEAVDPVEGALFLRLAWISNFCASFAMGAVGSLMVYVGARRGFGLHEIGLVLFAKDFGRFLGFVAFRTWPGWHYRIRWLLGGQAIGGAALVLAGYVHPIPALLVLVAALGAFSGLSYYSSLYYGLNLRSGEGKKSAVHEGILAAGWCLGPLACGAVGDRFPSWPGVVLASAGAVLLAGVILEAAVYLRGRGKDRAG